MSYSVDCSFCSRTNKYIKNNRAKEHSAPSGLVETRNMFWTLFVIGTILSSISLSQLYWLIGSTSLQWFEQLVTTVFLPGVLASAILWTCFFFVLPFMITGSKIIKKAKTLIHFHDQKEDRWHRHLDTGEWLIFLDENGRYSIANHKNDVFFKTDIIFETSPVKKMNQVQKPSRIPIVMDCHEDKEGKLVVTISLMRENAVLRTNTIHFDDHNLNCVISTLMSEASQDCPESLNPGDICGQLGKICFIALNAKLMLGAFRKLTQEGELRNTLGKTKYADFFLLLARSITISDLPLHVETSERIEKQRVLAEQKILMMLEEWRRRRETIQEAN